jgi:large subunit ribosomal protein L35
MPKMKTNRMARKKIRVSSGGRLKKAQANTSHNSGKKPAKRMRQLRGRKGIDKTSDSAMARMLPYSC